MIVMILISALIIISKRRAKDHFVYLLLILAAVLNFEHVCGAEVQLAKIDDIDERLESLDIHLLLILNNLFLSAVFISPSLNFLVFGYGPPYAVANLYLMFKYGDFENSVFQNSAMTTLVYALMAIPVFYIFQHRELMRFFELKQSEKKSEQLLSILNCQSNSILVAQSSEDDPKKPNVVFRNEQSLTLFGKILSEAS